jgi:multiple sugar transport system permease protein
MSSPDIAVGKWSQAGAYRQRSGRFTRRAASYAVVVGGALLMMAPFLYMISTSLKTPIEAVKFPPAWIPRPVVWRNYLDIWIQLPLARVSFNSAKISILATLGQVISCSLAAFAFSQLKYRGRDFLFMVVLATLMIPGQVTLIPTFLLFRALGWVNTHAPLIVPSWFGGAFGIFLIRQFFLTVPQELADAAKVDGCNPFRIYWQIFMPLAKPVLATLAIFTFFNSWNDLLTPLIYLRDLDLMTFPVALTFLSGRFSVNLPLLMATSVVSIVPTLVLFLALQKYFVQGIVLSGLKA